MIYTITLNPSIDYYIMANDIVVGDINRFDNYKYLAAGKGINCSKILNQFGIDSRAIYFSGNSTGEYIDRHLKKYKCISTCPVVNDEPTRINVKILGKQETAFNAAGPNISDKAKQELLKVVDQFEENDFVIISGSLPKNVDKSYVKEICHRAQKRNVKIVVDVPDFKIEDFDGLDIYLIKPNIDEFKYLLSNPQINEDNYKDYINQPHLKGVKNILLSLGKRGSYYSGEFGQYQITVPQVKAFSTVGAGDSMLASFIGAIAQGKDIKEALVLANATAAAMVMSEDLPSLELIREVISCIKLI